jgi:hypothetical protein
LISARIKVQEETILKRDEDIKTLQTKVDQYESQIQRLQKMFDSKYNEIIQQRDLLDSELHKRDEELQIEKIKNSDIIKTMEEDF